MQQQPDGGSPGREVTVNMNMNGPTQARRASLLNRTLDLRSGTASRQPERSQAVEVFHIGRNEHVEGSERGSMKSTTSF